MIVYQSTKQGFRDDVFSNEIDKKILEAYKAGGIRQLTGTAV